MSKIGIYFSDCTDGFDFYLTSADHNVTIDCSGASFHMHPDILLEVFSRLNWTWIRQIYIWDNCYEVIFTKDVETEYLSLPNLESIVLLEDGQTDSRPVFMVDSEILTGADLANQLAGMACGCLPVITITVGRIFDAIQYLLVIIKNGQTGKFFKYLVQYSWLN